jgi:hypothetical protein
MTDDPQRRFRGMVWLLREFEGHRCLWRIPTAAITYATPAILTLVGAVAAIYIGSDLKLYRVVLGAAVSLGLTALAGLVARRRLWWSILAARLWSYEAPNPRATHEALIRDEDVTRAYHVLRRSKFVPMYGARVGMPPPDATDLTTRIGVQEPAAWARSTSDEDRIRRIAAVFEATGMRARVAGRDVFPGGTIEARRTDDGPSLATSVERA